MHQRAIIPHCSSPEQTLPGKYKYLCAFFFFFVQLKSTGPTYCENVLLLLLLRQGPTCDLPTLVFQMLGLLVCATASGKSVTLTTFEFL